MDRQIVDPDPGKNYNAAISALRNGKKKMYIAILQIVARLQIAILDDTVLLRKNIVRFRQNMNHK